MENIDKLVDIEYNPLNIIESLKSENNISNIDKFKKNILDNMTYVFYKPKGVFKNDYKTFYVKYTNKINILKKTYIICKLSINQFGDKVISSLRNISNISYSTSILLEVIIKQFEKELLCKEYLPIRLIRDDEKFRDFKKNIPSDIKYHLHKHFGTNKYPGISLQNYDMTIIFNDEFENKKYVFKISSDDCEKISNSKKIDQYIKLIQWLNNTADKSYAKIAPLKSTIAIKGIGSVISEELFKAYDANIYNFTNTNCIVYNTHFEAKMIYCYNKKTNTESIDEYMNEENIDDDYIFSSSVTLEEVEKNLSILETYDIKYTKQTFKINENTIEDNEIYNDMDNE